MGTGALGIGSTPPGATLAFGPTPAATTRAAGTMTNAKARTAAQDFEAMFLNAMFSQMMTKTDGEGPFGGSQATGVWRSFLTNEYAKTFAQAGGIGLAKHVYSSLLAQQEAKAK
jgi:Rod binding domain-containing protein